MAGGEGELEAEKERKWDSQRLNEAVSRSVCDTSHPAQTKNTMRLRETMKAAEEQGKADQSKEQWGGELAGNPQQLSPKLHAAWERGLGSQPLPHTL